MRVYLDATPNSLVSIVAQADGPGCRVFDWIGGVYELYPVEDGTYQLEHQIPVETGGLIYFLVENISQETRYVSLSYEKVDSEPVQNTPPPGVCEDGIPLRASVGIRTPEMNDDAYAGLPFSLTINGQCSHVVQGNLPEGGYYEGLIHDRQLTSVTVTLDFNGHLLQSHFDLFYDQTVLDAYFHLHLECLVIQGGAPSFEFQLDCMHPDEFVTAW